MVGKTRVAAGVGNHHNLIAFGGVAAKRPFAGHLPDVQTETRFEKLRVTL